MWSVFLAILVVLIVEANNVNLIVDRNVFQYTYDKCDSEREKICLHTFKTWYIIEKNDCTMTSVPCHVLFTLKKLQFGVDIGCQSDFHLESHTVT